MSRPLRYKPPRLAGAVTLWLLLGVLLSPLGAAAQPAPGTAAAPSASASAAADRGDPVARAQEHFDRGEFAEGRKVLNQAAMDRRRDHREYARLLVKLAFFYEHYVGDYRYVQGYLREIRKLKLPADSLQLVEAGVIQKRVDALARDFEEEEAYLAKVRIYSKEPEILRERIALLQALIQRRPDYPRLAAAYHYLGENQLRLEHYPDAYRAFERALELRPAIMFSLPTAERKEKAFELWVRRDLARWSWGLLGALGLLGGVLFFSARPWRRLTWRHLAVLLGLSAAWWLFFRAAVWLLGDTALAATLPPPIYIQTSFDSPLSEGLDKLFQYGLFGICLAFVIIVSTARLKPRWTWACISSAVVLLLFASLLTQLVLRHGTTPFQPAGEGRYPYLRGSFNYPLSTDVDAFLLTDPLSYCQFQKTINNMDEDEIKRWFASYAKGCPEQQ